MLDFIVWNPDVVAFHLITFPVRWYSLCWVLALVWAYICMKRLYTKQGIEEKLFEPLFLYCFIGVLAGARLGHCLFYEPAYYLNHIVEMLLPIRHYEDGWRLVGYEGLASHGGVIGLCVAIWLYSRKTGVKMMTVFDNMGITVALSCAFIRLGNLMNSEIVGNTTNAWWGFVFVRNGEDFARHPAQLYEAIAYVLIFIIIMFLYKSQVAKTKVDNSRLKVGNGFYFGLCLTLIFIFRFFVEFVKAEQVEFENGMLFNMGQILSLPIIAVGIWCMVKANKDK